jgi:hypothetical protein
MEASRHEARFIRKQHAKLLTVWAPESLFSIPAD